MFAGKFLLVLLFFLCMSLTTSSNHFDRFTVPKSDPNWFTYKVGLGYCVSRNCTNNTM